MLARLRCSSFIRRCRVTQRNHTLDLISLLARCHFWRCCFIQEVTEASKNLYKCEISNPVCCTICKKSCWMVEIKWGPKFSTLLSSNYHAARPVVKTESFWINVLKYLLASNLESKLQYKSRCGIIPMALEQYW